MGLGYLCNNVTFILLPETSLLWTYKQQVIKFCLLSIDNRFRGYRMSSIIFEVHQHKPSLDFIQIWCMQWQHVASNIHNVFFFIIFFMAILAVFFILVLYPSDVVTGKGSPHYWPLWGESTIHWWIPVAKGQLCGALKLLLLVWTSCGTNNWITVDLRHHDVHVTS